MDKAKLEAAQARIKKASDLAADIEALEKVQPFQQFGIDLRFRQNGNDVLSSELLRSVVLAGKIKLLADKEAELQQLIGDEKVPEPPTE